MREEMVTVANTITALHNKEITISQNKEAANRIMCAGDTTYCDFGQGGIYTFINRFHLTQKPRPLGFAVVVNQKNEINHARFLFRIWCNVVIENKFNIEYLPGNWVIRYDFDINIYNGYAAALGILLDTTLTQKFHDGKFINEYKKLTTDAAMHSKVMKNGSQILDQILSGCRVHKRKLIFLFVNLCSFFCDIPKNHVAISQHFKICEMIELFACRL